MWDIVAHCAWDKFTQRATVCHTTEMRMIHTTVRLPEDLLEELCREAGTAGVSVGWVIRKRLSSGGLDAGSVASSAQTGRSPDLSSGRGVEGHARYAAVPGRGDRTNTEKVSSPSAPKNSHAPTCGCLMCKPGK